MSEKYFVGNDITSFSDNGKYKPISRVTLLVDDENSLTAGDDTGMELVASCPHATQAMVNSLLQTVKGYQYQAYEAGAANIDPAAELGDGVTVGGVYSPLSKIIDNGRGYADISSPGEMEMEDEYPSEGYIAQEFNRKIAETRSAITKTSEEIILEIQGVDGRVSSLQLTLDGVTITGSDGVTRINGGMIEANSVTATQIDATNLQVDAANITGTLTIGQLPSGVAQTSQIPTKTSQLFNDSSYQTAQGVTTIINGTVTTDYIYALGVEASTLRGSTIALKDAYGNTVGGFTLAYTTSGYGLGMTTLAGGINISSGDNVYIASKYNTRLQLDQQAAKIGPTVWATDGTVIYSSDRNVKNSIEYDLSKYRQFLLDLKPCRFKYNDGQSGRFHVGLIAQDVEQSLIDNNLDSKEFAGWCKMENLDAKGTYTYGIRYDDIVPLNTMMIQELVKRLDVLETKLEGIA